GVVTREGKGWRHSNVGRLLHRKSYVGEHTWGTGTTKITIPVPLLVSAQTWTRAQAAIALNVKACTGHSKHPFLLRGFIHCQFCHRTMSGITDVTNGRSYRYYRCMSFNDPARKQACPGRFLKADEVEGVVWGSLRSWILHRKEFDLALTEAVREQQQQ